MGNVPFPFMKFWFIVLAWLFVITSWILHLHAEGSCWEHLIYMRIWGFSWSLLFSFFFSSLLTLNIQEVSLSTGSHIASCIWGILTVSVGCTQKYCQLLEVFSAEQCCSFTDFLFVLFLLPLTDWFLCISLMLQKLSCCQTSWKLLPCQNHRNTELIGLERTSGDHPVQPQYKISNSRHKVWMPFLCWSP